MVGVRLARGQWGCLLPADDAHSASFRFRLTHGDGIDAGRQQLRVTTAITASFGGLSQDDGAHGNEAVIAVGALRWCQRCGTPRNDGCSIVSV